MIATCRTAKGRELPANYRGLYFTEATVFHVTPGQSYRVHEMALFNSGLTFLVVDDDGQPNWYPAELFDVEDGRLPANWLFALRDGGERGTQAVWGHPRLVDDPDLDDSLADQDPDARVVFWREVAVPGERSGDAPQAPAQDR
jgi:hypothetical protein